MNQKEREYEEIASVVCMFETIQLRRPEKATKVISRIDEKLAVLFNVFDDHDDADNLINALCTIANDLKALSHYKGFYQGVKLAQRLAKVPKKKGVRYKDAIVRIIIQHPDWTARQIFDELDNKKIRLIYLGRVEKAVHTKWLHVADESPYKVLISRLRNYVNDVVQMNGLKLIIKEHEQLRRQI
jgi:hypothetical protein